MAPRLASWTVRRSSPREAVCEAATEAGHYRCRGCPSAPLAGTKAISVAGRSWCLQLQRDGDYILAGACLAERSKTVS
jgi:hypothetical protein